MNRQAKAGAASNYQTMLHSVQQKQLNKTWKRPDHPLPAPKVYRVDPRGFRDLVQQLTGAASTSPPPLIPSRPLRDTAPAPPSLYLAPRPSSLEYNVEAADSLDVDGAGANGGANSAGGFMDLLSPSFFSGWWTLHGDGLEA